MFVLAVLVGSSLWAGYDSYNRTRQEIVSDMNQALALTLSEKQEEWITPDTIQSYRSHLQMAGLKECSYVYYAMDHRADGLCSRRMRWQRDANVQEFQGYANCSAASVLSMSDQRVSGVLSVAALVWGLASLFYFRRPCQEGMTVVGQLMMSDADQCFYDLHHRRVRLTPMQEQLMRMFFLAPGHQLSKQQICDALWPRKPDASETLYTLIRRLKPIAGEQGNLEIVNERGKDYQLRVRK